MKNFFPIFAQSDTIFKNTMERADDTFYGKKFIYNEPKQKYTFI